MANDIRIARVVGQTPLGPGQVTYTTTDPLGDFLPRLAIIKISGANSLTQLPADDNRDFFVCFGATDGVTQYTGYNYGRGQTGGTGQARRYQTDGRCAAVPRNTTQAGQQAAVANFVSFQQVGGLASITLDWEDSGPGPGGQTFEYVIEIDFWGGADLQFQLGATVLDSPRIFQEFGVGFRPTAIWGWTCGQPTLGVNQAFCTHSAGWVAFKDPPAELPQPAEGYASTFATYANGTSQGTGGSGVSADKWLAQLNAGRNEIGWYIDTVRSQQTGFDFVCRDVQFGPGNDWIFWVAMRFDDLESAAGIGVSPTTPGQQNFTQIWTEPGSGAPEYVSIVYSRAPDLQVGQEDFDGNGGTQFFTCINASLTQTSWGSHTDDGVTIAGATGTNRSWYSNGLGRVLEPSAAGNRPYTQFTLNSFFIRGFSLDWQVVPATTHQFTWFAVEQRRVAVPDFPRVVSIV